MQIASPGIRRGNRRQYAPLDRLRRVGRDDPGLHPDLANHAIAVT